MCTSNVFMDDGICNGSLGVVEGFDTADGYPIVQFTNGQRKTMGPYVWETEDRVKISQIPLILAWSTTIHKIQGATLDYAEIDVGHRIFECGQTYVAMSRVRSLKGLYLLSFNPHRIKVNKKVQAFYKGLATADAK